MATIKSIQPIKRRKDLFNVQFNDEEKIQVSASAISRFDLYAGKELKQSQMTELVSASQISSLKTYCFAILARKMYTVSEIENKLRQKTKNPNYIESIINDLKKLKLLDDTDYAEVYIRSMKSKKKYSWKEIRFRLYQKGITLDPENINNEEIETYEFETALGLVGKKINLDSAPDKYLKERKKIFDYLFRKGFSMEIINRVLSQFRQ